MRQYLEYCINFIEDQIVYWFSKMNKRLRQEVCYNFKPFHFEEIMPSVKCTQIPNPRSGHRIAADSKNLYVFGGYNPMFEDYQDDDAELRNSFPLFQELWRFNYASKVWTRYNNIRSLPQELASNAVVRLGNLLMVYGGTGSPFGQRCSNKLYICKLHGKDTNMHEISTTGEHPLPQYGQALVCEGGYLYTIGGTTGYDYTCDIHRLHLKTLVWEPVYVCQGTGDCEPEGRYRHEVAFDKNKLYVLGGGTAVEVYDFQHIYVFSLEKSIWYLQHTVRDPRFMTSNGIPRPRRCHGAVQLNTEHGTEVFIVGGYNGQDVFNDLWKLSLSTHQWTLIPNCQLPQPTYFHSAAASPEGKLYVFGGLVGDPYDGDIERTNKVYATWLCIPKLSEMCWEAVLHYSPHIINYDREKLLNAGLPKSYVERLD